MAGFRFGGRRGTASSFANAGMAIQALYQPGVKHVIEQMAEEQSRREEDDDGDPPEPGDVPRRQPRDGY